MFNIESEIYEEQIINDEVKVEDVLKRRLI